MSCSSVLAPTVRPPFIQVRGLTVRYSGCKQPALLDLNFDISRGEIVGVLGESGSGKSTLALSMLGLLPGSAKIDGSIVFQETLGDQEQREQTRERDLLHFNEQKWRAVRGAKIAMIFQEPGLSLSPVMRVGDQIAEILRAHHQDEEKTRRQQVVALLQRVQLVEADRVYNAYPHQLSGGQLHRIAIAQALACSPGLLLADEATRALDVTLQTELLALLRQMNRELGSALLFITHNPALLAGFADRVLVMHAGRIVEEGRAERVFREPQHPRTRTLMRLSPSARRTPGEVSIVATEKATSCVPETNLVKANHLSKSYTQRAPFSRKEFVIEALAEVDFEIAPGSVTALVGESGSGKSTLATCLAMLEKPDSGEIWFDGQEVSRLKARELSPLRHRIQMVFQDSAGALNPRFSAWEIIAEPLEIRSRENTRKLRTRACEFMEEVGLSPDWADRGPLEFSGGQRQRLAIARAIALKPSFLILDEALSGLDLVTQALILDLLLDLRAAHGLTYLLISHDFRLVGEVADSIAVMHKGRIVEQGRRREIIGHPRNVHTQELLGSVKKVESAYRTAKAGSTR